MKFNTQYDRVTPLTAETNYAASETIPDDSLSIPEILSKYIRGQRVDGSFPSGFETPEEGVDGTFDELFDGVSNSDLKYPVTQDGGLETPPEKSVEGQKVDE